MPGASPPKSPPRTQCQEATGSFLGHSTCLSPPPPHLPSTCCGKAKCCRQPWPFCSPLDLCSFLIRFLIPLWAHCSAYPKTDTSQADERNHRGEQSLHLGGSELAASGRVGDIARYKQQAGAGFGNRKGSLGKNGQHREMRPFYYFLTWSPPTLPSFLRPQGDLAIFDQGSQCAAPRASCDFGTGEGS